MSDEILKLSLEDKLYRTKYEPDPDTSHISINLDYCKICEMKPCTYVCPARVYRVDPNNSNHVTVSHENCLECGTCIHICTYSIIDWKCPDSGIGVKYRFG